MSLSLKEIEFNFNRICDKYMCVKCPLEKYCSIGDIVKAEKIISDWVKDNPDEVYHDHDFPDEDDPKSYEDGLNDAWELAKMIVRPDGYSNEKITDIFECETIDDIFLKSSKEVFEKMKEYDDKHVEYGDIIIASSIGNERLIVVDVSDRYIRCISGNFNDYTLSMKTDDFEKTGLNVSDELDELLSVGGWEAEEYDRK